MIRRPVTFKDYNGKTITENYYFNLNKLQLMELEIEQEGGLQSYIEELTNTRSGEKAYYLFKKIVLRSIGVMSSDAREFNREDEKGRSYAKKFEASNALSELIFSLIENPEDAMKFVEGIAPQEAIAEARADVQAARMRETPELAPVAPVLEDPSENTDRAFEEYSRQELLEMSDEQYNKLVPSDIRLQSKEQLLISMQRKSSSKN